MFLTAKDLRVGNYVNYDNTTHVIKEIHQKEVIHFWVNGGTEDIVSKYTGILSIPLTPREIERFGFNKNLNHYLNNDGYCIEEDGDDFWLCQSGSKVIRIAAIEFVHELQNLYYEVKKKELIY